MITRFGDQKNTLIRCGELNCVKGQKKASAQILRQSTYNPVDSTPQLTEWRRAFAILSNDHRLVLFECESAPSPDGSAPKPLLTKVISSIDIGSLGSHSIQLAHDSITGRKFTFVIQTRERPFYLSLPSELERDEWTVELNKLLRQLIFQPNEL